jgi:hypothetical protein
VRVLSTEGDVECSHHGWWFAQKMYVCKSNKRVKEKGFLPFDAVATGVAFLDTNSG